MRREHHELILGAHPRRIRRIRCDEEIPSCRRCVSTGRQCDGYVTSNTITTALPPLSIAAPRSHSSAEQLAINIPSRIGAHRPTIAPKPPHVRADLILHLSRQPTEELRSYRFFTEVAAPSLAGAINGDFWLREIPRACQADEALWHAVVGLGSAYESYMDGGNGDKPLWYPRQNVRTLRHYNAAIRGLTGSSKPETWKALTASTMFTCISILQGRLEEARLHFRSGCRLLGDVEREASSSPESDTAVVTSISKRAVKQVTAVPVSLHSIRSMLIGFEMVESKFSPHATTQPPKLLTLTDDNYSAWQSYSLPLPSLRGRILTEYNLSQAVKAAESLYVTLTIITTVQASRLRTVLEEGGYDAVVAEAGFQDSKPLVDKFKILEEAARMFGSELDAPRGSKVKTIEATALRKSYLSLVIIQGTSRLLLSADPDDSDPKDRLKSLSKVSATIVDLAMELYSLETSVGCLRVGGPAALATVMNPLVSVVKISFDRTIRERAIRLLSESRLEGIWDTRIGASISKIMLERETAATKEYRQCPELEGIAIDQPIARGWDDEEENGGEFIHSLARIRTYTLDFSTARDVKITVWTWKEWLERKQGETSMMTW